MGSLSLTHWVIVLVVAMVLFGRGRISETMGDFGKGITSFRKGMAGEDESAPAKSIETLPTIRAEIESAPVKPE
ncbi:hypothetical protein GCM10009127_15240 [Alteraurantiacibacter aestuarii]|uniref:Sec-independent protein translocase protein TatA n=1 Tax=Alteraurantiacibacter aestuarii TaxID=650004 RepID=A0A844ZQK7_9SPHN|nr:twin-arginine translocase TatA/TatE family subunit [Alteraurantiacibacter aestuarii]MXO87889.1 twin-arginine translocase TatA/TatE family subunit [Alteraurantiacibacter aestuarii]